MIRFNQEERQYEVVIPLHEGLKDAGRYQEAILTALEVCRDAESDAFIDPYHTYHLISLMRQFSLDFLQLGALEETGLLEKKLRGTTPNITKLEKELETLKQQLPEGQNLKTNPTDKYPNALLDQS